MSAGRDRGALRRSAKALIVIWREDAARLDEESDVGSVSRRVTLRVCASDLAAALGGVGAAGKEQQEDEKYND